MKDSIKNKGNLFIAFLVIANLVLLSYYFSKNNQPHHDDRLKYIDSGKLLKTLRNVKLNYLSVSEDFDDWLSSKRYKLLVIFSPMDCPGCLRSLNYWNEIEKLSRHTVFGIVAYKHLNEIKLFLKNEKIKFDIGIDQSRKIFNYIHGEDSPMQIILDSDNNIIFKRKADGSSSSGKALIQQIKSFIN